jgi:hypothetical protein
MLVDAAFMLPSVLLSVAAYGSVVAPSWLLPTAAATTVAIPLIMLPMLKGMEQDKKDWETKAPEVHESNCAMHPDAFAVGDAGAKGQGLFVMRSIKKGTFLFDYTGEHLSQMEYNVRYPDSVSDYTVGLRLPNGGMNFIDGRHEVLGAPARFMNHDGRSPNVGRRTFCKEGVAPRVLMYAIADLQIGDELQWNYGDGYWAARSGLIEDI